jgi:hypothetical protein
MRSFTKRTLTAIVFGVALCLPSIGRYLDFYNDRRPHSSLDDMTPDQAYFNLPPLRAAA